MAIVPSMLALQAVVGQAARAAAVPAVTSVSPNVGIDSGGRLVTISGSDFTNATEVEFGSDPVDFTVNSDTEITTVSPPRARTAPSTSP